MAGPPNTDTVRRLVGAFREGLREYGYVEGETIQVEWRHSEGTEEPYYEGFVADFVRMPVDIIVSGITAAQRAARRATRTIPIVMASSNDPVASGLVDSLARPGGNVTGMGIDVGRTAGKRLELLREVVPSITRVGAIWDGAVDRSASLRGAQEAARGLSIEVVELVVRARSDLLGALDLATKRSVEALLILAVPIQIIEFRREIAAYALERRIPTASPEIGQWVEAGGLIAFGDSGVESYRRAAYFVDRILKGAKPSELPIEQPAKFDLIVNLKTAKEIGVTVPQSVLSRATKVIQ